jgi:RNA polymerase sigma factor (sigma-70 family)
MRLGGRNTKWIRCNAARGACSIIGMNAVAEEPRRDPAPPPADSDLALLARWRAGDATAGQTLVERYFQALYRFFANKCGAEADELVQRTLLACVKARDQFRADASFRTYVFTIARNELYHFLRALRDGRQVDFSITSVAELVTTPGTQLDRDAAQRRLAAAMRELSVDDQTLLELYYWEELEIAEIAEIFEALPATVRVWLFRARAALKDKLGEDVLPSPRS